MSGRLLLTGAGAVTSHGLGLDALRGAIAGDGKPFDIEEVAPGRTVAVARVGRLQDPASQAVYDRWGQVDNYSRYAMSAARMALEAAGFAADSDQRRPLGVVLGTAWGCVEENQRFERWEVQEGKIVGAAPIIFKVTVDNAPAGWISVAFRLQGPNETFVSGDGAGLEAMWSAEGLLHRGAAPALLVGGVERVVDLHLVLEIHDPARHHPVLAEGSGVVLIEREDAWLARGGPPPLAELVGVARVHGTLPEALKKALGRLAADPAQVGLAVLGAPDLVDGSLSTALSAAEILLAKRFLGEPHGAWGGLATAVALARRDNGNGWSGRSLALIHAFGEGDEHFVALLREPNQESR